MFETFILAASAFAEFAIFSYVIGYVCIRMIPWREMREKKRVRAEVARMIPMLRERTASVAGRGAGRKNVVRGATYRQMVVTMTADVAMLSAYCRRSLMTVAEKYETWPRESLQIAQNVAATLDIAERMIRLRDESVPRVMRMMADVVAERMDGLELMRVRLVDRLATEEKDGIIMPYESQRLVMLSNAFSAHRLLISEDPDAVVAFVPVWIATLRAIAESIEFRSTVARRVREVRSEVPKRVKRVRELAAAVRPVFSATQDAVPSESVLARVMLAQAAESDANRAEEELRRAEEYMALPVRDVGAKGESAGRLSAALRSAELAIGLLDGFEKDLMVVLAALAAGHGGDSTSIN